MPTTSVASDNLDKILAKIGQKIGKYQIKNFISLFIPTTLSAMFLLSFVFTARNLDYRCLIPECDLPVTHYKPPWFLNAMPVDSNNNPSRCKRYAPIPSYINNSVEFLCPADLFNYSITQTCNEFIFDTDEVNIVNDFGLMCDENLWKLTTVGTINNIGQLVCAPVAGYLADRYGRRLSVVASILLSSLMGALRSFAPSYLWFLLLEFLDMALGSGAYNAAFILGVELASPEKRIVTILLLTTGYIIGTGAIGVIAWTFNNWREFLRYLYFPGFIIIVFLWLLPESLRWLLTQGRHEEVKNLLRQAAKENNIELTEYELKSVECQSEQQPESYPIKTLFTSRILLLRLLNCFYCWITASLIYAGLSLMSVSIAGNMYLNFVLAAVIEIPALVITYLILDRLGRRITLCGALILTGVACLTFTFISADATWVNLTVYLVAKFGVAIGFDTLYIFTSEMFPTSLRNSIMGACVMTGRIGSMTAPQAPFLAQVMASLPLILFGVIAVSAGLLVLLFPETLNTKLPDTIEEAELIGLEEIFDTPL